MAGLGLVLATVLVAVQPAPAHADYEYTIFEGTMTVGSLSTVPPGGTLPNISWGYNPNRYGSLSPNTATIEGQSIIIDLIVYTFRGVGGIDDAKIYFGRELPIDVNDQLIMYANNTRVELPRRICSGCEHQYQSGTNHGLDWTNGETVKIKLALLIRSPTNAVTNLSATQSGSHVKLLWTPPEDDGSTVSFLEYRFRKGGGGWSDSRTP